MSPNGCIWFLLPNKFGLHVFFETLTRGFRNLGIQGQAVIENEAERSYHKLLQSHYKVITKLLQSYHKVITKLSQSYYKVITKLLQSYCKVITKLLQSMKKFITKCLRYYKV